MMNMVMFGRKAVLPVDFNSWENYNPDEEFNEAPFLDPDAIAAYWSVLDVVVKNNIEIAQEKQKENYDGKHTMAGSFSSGVLVLKKDFIWKWRRGGALDFRVVGPVHHHKQPWQGPIPVGFHLKPYHAYDLEWGDCTDDVELKNGDEIVELVDDVDIMDHVDRADVAELKDDELKDSHWISCDVIDCPQPLLKKQLPDQNGLQSTNVLKEKKPVPEALCRLFMMTATEFAHQIVSAEVEKWRYLTG